MDGYLKPNAKNENRELHLLTLEDCEFVPDDELKTHFISGRKHNCPRCGATTHITGDDPDQPGVFIPLPRLDLHGKLLPVRSTGFWNRSLVS